MIRALERIGMHAPHSMSWSAAGIDLSSGSIKVVTLAHTHGLELKAYGAIALQPGVVEDGDIEKPEQLIEALRAVRLKYRIRYAHASLSEKKAFVYQILVPHDATSIKDVVEYGIEAHVPLPPQETVYDFEPVRQTADGTVVAVSAYARRIVQAREAAFSAAGITLRSLEVESHAIARAAIAPADRSRVIMLVDFGKTTTRIVVCDHGVVSYTATMDLGGDMLTAALTKHLSIDAAEAERVKNARGFLISPDNADVVEAVLGVVSVMKDELMRHRAYWDAPSVDDVQRTAIEKVVISGGNANMRGFAEYLSDALALPVTTAQVWQNAFSLDRYIPPMSANESLEYAPAIGLSLRSARNQSW